MAPLTRLDDFAPAWHFHEIHRIDVHAPAVRVYRSILALTAGEIRLFRLLTWVRRLGRRGGGPESILNAPPDVPLIEVATRSGFLVLAALPVREIVIGTVVIAPPGGQRPATPDAYRAVQGPGWAKATMNFLIEEGGSKCVVSSETRVYATDPRTRRRFRLYWMLVHPGSALIRRMWLRAIKRRAEA